MKEKKADSLMSIGARIRKARTEASLTIRKLAEETGITASYLSMVERGEKNPSTTLLRKIAEATDAPSGWLDENPAVRAAAAANTWEPEFSVRVPTDIDIPLFLAMALQSIPGMTKDKLADLLAVSPEAMDNVLSGKGLDPAFRQKDHLSFLARQTDIPTLRQQIRKIDMFLLHENMEKKKTCLHETLQKVAGTEYQYLKIVSSAVKEVAEDDLSRSTDSVIDHIVLQKNASPADDWHFVFCRFSGDVDRYMIRDIIGSQITYANSTGSQLTIVVEREDILHLFEDNYSRLKMENDAIAEKKPDAEPLPPISLLLVNPDTWAESGELIMLEDEYDDCPD